MMTPAVRPDRQTFLALEEAFVEVETRLRESGGLGDTRRYASLLHAAATSPQKSEGAALGVHLRKRGDFSQGMGVVSFIKKADEFDFEAIGIYDSLDEGNTLVLARSDDAQIMLAKVMDDVVVEVELCRFLLRESSEPLFHTELFAREETTFVDNYMITVLHPTIHLLGLMVSFDREAGRLSPDWKLGNLPQSRGLLMARERHRQNWEQVVKLRSDAFIGKWRDIFCLDLPTHHSARDKSTGCHE